MAKHSVSRPRSIAKGLRSTPVRAVLSLGVVFGFGAVGTLAYWTDSATLSGGDFVSGNLDINLSDPPSSTDFTSRFALTNMLPGHSKAAIVIVNNDGTADFTYTATGAAPGPLAPKLRFRVVSGATVSGAGSSQTCSGGSQLFDGALGATATAVIGANRPLSADQDETLCLEARMPTGVEDGQSLSTTVAFTFDAKQVGAP